MSFPPALDRLSETSETTRSLLRPHRQLAGFFSWRSRAIAALTGFLTVSLTELLASSRKAKDDAAVGLVFPALFLIGVLPLNVYVRDVHIDAHTVLLGEIGFIWLKTMAVLG